MSGKEPSKRGRPAKIDKNILCDEILKFKDKILREDGGIVSKYEPIWTDISEKLDHVKTEAALYTFVTCNKFGIRSKLMGAKYSKACAVSLQADDSAPDETGLTLNDSCSSTDDSGMSFEIHVPKSDIDELIVHKVYKSRKLKNGTRNREVTRFIPGAWQNLLRTKIWNRTSSKCGYHMDYHSLTRDGKKGHIVGHCDCGLTLTCDFLQSDENNVTTIECRVTMGNGQCGKVYVRAPTRKAVAEDLRHKQVCVYRAEKADSLMKKGDPEPAILPKPETLRTIKHEFAASLQLHSDPIKALQVMQLHNMKHVIQSIGLSPFHVIYATNHQRSIYRTYARRENACVAIDATGSIIKPIPRPDKSTSRAIFLYICVIRSDCEGQITVAQFLSERHHTNAISFWLREWIEKPGLPPPKEIVCDASKALLTATIRAFTNYSTINDYADACKNETMPSCYIRIDVAHFIKLYANFLKDLRPPVKKFYLAIIGQIILSCDIERTLKIVYAVLVVALSNTEGNMSNDEPSACKKAKTYLSTVLTSTESEHGKTSDEYTATADDDPETADEDDPEELLKPNKWREWAQDIHRSVLQEVEFAVGLRINAHYFPALATRLMRDLTWLPLWSCVARNTFGYGRIPASSAPVEIELKNIKVHLLKGETLPMRADKFVEKHVGYINGAMKLAEAAATKVSPELGDEHHSESFENTLKSNDDLQGTAQLACLGNVTKRKPDGSHTCFVCREVVDVCCSRVIDDEDYNQHHICIGCEKQKNVPDILASRHFEGWGGFVETDEKKPQGRYLREKYGDNEFILEDQIRKLPVLKNGGNVTLKSVASGDERIDVANTCAIDSAFQIFLTGASDQPSFRTFIESHMLENDFFRMVHEVLNKGVRAATYRLRCKILSAICERGPEQFKCVVLRCDITVGDLCRKLFKSTPSFQEESVCDEGCSPITTNLPIVMITLSSLLDKSHDAAIEEAISVARLRQCSTIGCPGIRKKSMRVAGNFVIFEIVPEVRLSDEETEPARETRKTKRRRTENEVRIFEDIAEHEAAVMLRDIPMSLQLSFMPQRYSLAGLVHLKHPNIITRSSDEGLTKSIGHYTAICYRRGTWVEFDDTAHNQTGKRQTNKRKVAPNLIIYIC